MKTVTMLEFRKDAGRVLRLVLSHRGKPAARLEPLSSPPDADLAGDPFLSIGRRAQPSPKGKTRHAQRDRYFAHKTTPTSRRDAGQ